MPEAVRSIVDDFFATYRFTPHDVTIGRISRIVLWPIWSVPAGILAVSRKRLDPIPKTWSLKRWTRTGHRQRRSHETKDREAALQTGKPVLANILAEYRQLKGGK